MSHDLSVHLHYSLLVEGLFCYNIYFIITLFLLGSHHERYNEVAVYFHIVGSIAFTAIAVYFISRPSFDIQWQEKAVFSAFFVGAVLCLTFSWLFHTVYCHSERVGRFFNKYVMIQVQDYTTVQSTTGVNIK